MSFLSRQLIHGFFVCILVFALSVSAGLRAETNHVVSQSELQKQVVQSSRVREQNLARLRSFLSTPLATATIKKAHFDPVRVREGVANLTDDELSALAARVDHAQQDFAAGILSTRDLALIILVVVVVILIAVIAH